MKKFKTFIILLLFTLFLIPTTAFAADEKVSFKVSGADVKVGQSFTVTLSESGANEQYTLYSYNLTIEYDSSAIQFENGNGSNGATVNNNGNVVTISGNKQMSSDGDIATISFKALKDSKFPLKLDGSCSINGENSTCKLNSSQVSVRALGNDATLSGLSIPNTTLSPAFNKNVKDYTAEVKDVTSLEVKATASDANATIQISDNYKNLQKGDNTINVVVTSESGSKKNTYTIKVHLELTPSEEELRLANANLSTLEIKGQKIEFNADEVKYYLNVDYDVTSLDITAVPANENAKVEINGNEKFVVGKNTVNIVVTSEDGTTNKTYSILVTRLSQNKKIIKTCPDTTSVKEWIIFSAGLVLMFTLGIVLGYILGKKGVLQKIFKKKEKVEEPVEIQTLSDTIDLSDVVEEIKDDEDVKKA
jgi:hypothetical protein